MHPAARRASKGSLPAGAGRAMPVQAWHGMAEDASSAVHGRSAADLRDGKDHARRVELPRPEKQVVACRGQRAHCSLALS